MSTDGATGQELEELFSFTRSSYLNNLIAEAKNIYEDEFDPDFFIDDYREKLQMFRELAEKLREFHGNLRRIQEDTPTIAEQSERIIGSFDLMFRGIKTMEEYMEYREKDKIVEGLKEIKSANDAIFSAIDIVIQEEAKLEKYSKSPYVHELIRIAKGVISKGYPKETLKEKLDWMIDYCDGVYRDFQIYKSARFETTAIQEKIPAMETALEKFKAGLREMEDYFNDEDSSHIEKSIQMLRESGDVLIESCELIQSEIKSSSSKYCVKCGEMNPLTAKFCSKCSALLPETQAAADEPGGSMSISSGGEERPMASNIIRLSEVVKDFSEGRSSEQEVLDVIEWMEEKVRAGISDLQSMSPVEGSDEEREALESLGELLTQGTYELESALAEMKRFFEDGEAGHLREGLECAREASYKLYQVQERSNAMTSGS